VPPCAWGGGDGVCSVAEGLCWGNGWAGVSGAEGEADGCGVGEAAPTCASAGTSDAATSASVDPVRRRLRGMRQEAEYMRFLTEVMHTRLRGKATQTMC
jgi:hypothetical protein